MIYFIQCESTLLIKIGWTEGSPHDRLKQLQTGSPGGLRLLFSMPGDRELETELHHQLASAHDRGEWFRPTPDVLRFLLRAFGQKVCDQLLAEMAEAAAPRQEHFAAC